MILVRGPASGLSSLGDLYQAHNNPTGLCQESCENGWAYFNPFSDVINHRSLIERHWLVLVMNSAADKAD